MSDNYKIGLGVVVDTSDVQKQLNKKKDATLEANIKLNTDDVNLKKELIKIRNKFKNNKDATLESAIKFKLDDVALKKEIVEIKSKFNEKIGFSLDTREAVQSIQYTQKAYTELRKEVYQSIGQKPQVLQDMANYYKELEKENKKALDSLPKIASEQQKLSKANNMMSWLQNNSKAVKDYGTDVNLMIDKLRSADDMIIPEFRKINAEFEKIKLNARDTGNLGKTFGDKFKDMGEKFLSWVSVSSVIMAGIKYIKQMTQEVIACDTAMTELIKVSNASENELKNYFDDAAESAKRLGSSISDLISATADFSRLGFDLPDAKELAEVATLYKNVGDGISIDDASSSIVSTMKAFKIEAEDAIDIVNKFNEVGNNFAVSSGDIGEALKRSASSLAVSNNSLSESIGLITAGNTIIQDASVVGTALKTVSLRITSTSAALEEMGEDTEYACETLSDYRQLVLGLTKNKVNILGDDGEYKSTYQILKEISEVWDKMGSKEQSSLMKALFGTRQANVGASILENFNIAEEAMETAEESAGSAMREQEKYTQSIQYSLDRLSASFQELSNTVVSSTTIKAFVDIINALVNALDFAVENFGLFGTTLTLFSSGTLIKGLASSIFNLGTSFTSLSVGVGVAGTAIKSFLLTNPIGWVLLAGTAITGLAKVYDTLNTSVEEHEETIQTLKSDYEKLTSESSELESQLEDIGERIDDLNSKKSLTLVEQEQLKNLQLSNEELTTNIALLKEQQEIKQREIANEVKAKFDKDFTYNTKEKTYWTGQQTTYNGNSAKEYVTTSEGEYLQTIIGLYDEYNKKKESGLLLSSDEEDYLKTIRDELVQYALNIDKYVEDYGIDDEVSKSWKSLYTTISNLLYPSIKDTSKEIDKLNDTEVKIPLSLSDDQTKVIETFQSRLKTLKSAMDDIDNVNVLDLMKEFKDYDWTDFTNGKMTLREVLTDLSNITLDNATKSVGDLSDVLEKMFDDLFNRSDNIKKVADEYDYLSEVLSRVKGKQAISQEEMKKIINLYPSLADKITEVSGGYAIEESALTSLLNTSVTSYNQMISAAQESAKETINSTKKKIDAYKIERKFYNDLIKEQADNVVRSKTNLTYKSAGEMGSYSLESLKSVLGESLYNDYMLSQKELEGVNGLYKTYNQTKKELDSLMSTDFLKPLETKTKPSDKEFTGEIDYSKQSIEILTQSVSKLQTELNNTSGYDNQISILNSLEKAQKSLQNGYKKTAKEYSDKYKDSIKGLTEPDIKAITSGEVFEFKNYDGREDLYNQLINAQELYNAWQDILEKYDDTKIDLSKTLQTKSDLLFQQSVDEFENKINSINKTLSEIDHYTEFVDEDSIEQITLLQTGFETSSKKAGLLRDELDNLAKQYAKGTITQEQYSERVSSVSDALYSATSAMQKYKDGIVSSMKAKLDTDISDLEKAEKNTTDALKDQLDKYKKIVDEKKKALQLAKETHDYEKDIADKNKEIVKTQARVDDLKRAVDSGDTEANADYKKALEELAKLKEELTEKQYDREVDLQENALDEAYSNFEDNINSQITKTQNEYKIRTESIQKLYETEKNLIIEAANLTQNEFTKAYDNIKQIMESNYLSMSENFTGAYSRTEKSITTTSAVSSILSGADKSKDSEGLSGLNKYLVSKGYGVVSKDQMVQLAQALGLIEISSSQQVGTDDLGRKNKNKILEALKNAGFSNGGIASIDTSSSISRSLRSFTGEDGLAFVRNKEGLLTSNQTDIFKKMVDKLPQLNNLVDLNVPSYNQIEKSINSIEISGNLLTINGNVDTDVMTRMENFREQIGKDVARKIIDEVNKNITR